MDIIKKIFVAILVVGGINWGLYGLLRFDFVAFMFGGSMQLASRIIYSLVGVSAVVTFVLTFFPEKVEQQIADS